MMTEKDVLEAELYLNYFNQILSTDNSSKELCIRSYYKFQRDLEDNLDNLCFPALQTIKKHISIINSKSQNFTNYNPAIEVNWSIPLFNSFIEEYLYFQFVKLFNLDPTVKLEEQKVPYLLFPLYIGILSNLGYLTDDWKSLRYNAFSVAQNVKSLMSARKNNIVFPDNIPYNTCYKYLLNYYFSDAAFLCLNELENITMKGPYESSNRYNKKILNQYILKIGAFTLNKHNEIYNHLFESIKKYTNNTTETYFFDSNQIIDSCNELYSNIISEEITKYHNIFKEYEENKDMLSYEDILKKLFKEYKELKYKIDL